MNTLGIIQKEGYRVEDLTPEHQSTMAWLRNLRNDIAGSQFIEDIFCDYDDTLFDKLKQEFIEKVMVEVVHFIDLEIADIQIALAENEGLAESQEDV